MPTYDVTVEGKTYEVNAPDETTAWQWANYTHRQQKQQAPAPKPEGGFIAAAKAGATELGGGLSALAGKLGLKDEAKAEAEYQAAKKRAAEIFKPTEEGWTEAPLTKFKELLGGSVPYMAAPLAAGAAAAALPVTGTAAALTTLGAAGLTSAGQFTATNLARQMEEGKRLGETSLGAAAAAAIPQAALDTLSMRMIPGIGRLFGQAGIKITAENAKEIAEQGLKRTLADYAAKTGKTAGIEGATEATQQVFERLQAGLSITDPQARQEYFDSFLGGAVLGGTLAPAGRAFERGREQREARGLLEKQAQEERAAAAKAEAERKKDPDYILGIADEYDALSQQKEALKSQIVKGSKEAPLTQEDKDRNTLIQKQLSELEPQLKDKRKEYLSVGGPDAVQKLRESRLELTPPPGQVTAPPPDEVAPEPPEIAGPRAQKEVETLTALLEQQRTQLQAAQSPEEALELAQRTQRTKEALDKSQEALAKLPAAPEAPDLEALQTKLAEAQQAGDQESVIKYATQLIEARKQAPSQDMGLFDPAQMVAEDERRRQLAEQMATGREEAEAQRAQQEAAAQAAKDAEAQAEMQRVQEAQQLQQAPQMDMFPVAREDVTRTLQAPRLLPQQVAIQERIDALEQKRVEVADSPQRVAAIDQQIAKLQTAFDKIAPEGVETRTFAMPPQEPVAATQPPPTLTKQISTLAERVLASPRVDEQTKAVVQQIQADVPAFMRAATAQAAQGATEMRQRAATAMTQGPSKVVPKAAAEAFTPQQAAAWLYRTLNTGRADPADTARVQGVLQSMETAKRGEVEPVTQYAGRALTEAEKSAVRGTSMEGRVGTLTREPTEAVRRATQPELPGVEPRPAPAPAPAPAISTLATREAEDAAKRREEQARLERAEAMPRTLVQFEQQTGETLADEKYTKLVEAAYNPRLKAEERIQASEQADAYLQQKLAKIEAAEAARPALVQKKQADLAAAKQRLDALNTQLQNVKLSTREKAKTKGDTAAQEQILEAKRAKIQAAIKADEAKRDKHQRLLNAALNYPKVTRVDPAEIRAYREQLNQEVLRTRTPGERLGVAEGTLPRAIGPVTRAEVIPPKALRTESPESRAGVTATDTRQKLTEARGEKQRDVPITKAEMAEAEAQAAAMPTRVAREAFSTFTQEAKATKARATELATSTEAAEVKDVQQVVKSLDKLIKQADKEAAAFGISDESLRRWEKASFDLKTARSKLNVRLGKDVAFRESGPQYETRDLTDLTPAALEAVEDGDIRTALADLEKNGSTPFVRELAKHLGDMTMRTKLEVRDIVEQNGEQVEGLYIPSKNLVQLHRGALSEETLAHELTHAATMRALEADPSTLTPTQQAARKEIEGMHAAIEKQPEFTKEYGRKDVKEFVSELMSNRDFRNKLDAQKPSFVRRMYNAFMRVIGFPRATMSEKAVKAAYELFMPAQVLKAAPAPSAKRGAPGLATANRVSDQIIGKQPTVLDSIKKTLFGLSFRTQIIDSLAPLEQVANTSMDPLKGAQMMYYLRKYGMRNHMTAEAIENGVAQVKEITRADGQKERVIEAVPGANIKDIVKRLAAKDVVKEAGSADAANRLFTLYMSAIRGENKGFDKLNFGRAAALSELQKIERELASPRLEPQEKTQLNARKAYLEKNLDSMPTEADFRAAKAEIDANPTLKKAFDEAREMYNEYNTNLLNFLVQTGAVSKDEAARLLRAKDYIPYYRMRGGNAELMIGGETPIRIGNLKDSPHLQELVGGEEPIFDFLTSSVQNTSMLLDMGMRNIAAKNVAYELADAGLASKPARAGKAGAPKGTLEFKLDGEDYFVRVDTDYIGVPSDLLVKGMAGIPTMLPQGLRLMGIPAQILRRAVTSTPVFAAKQLFRDSLGAYMLSGSDAPPLLSAVNQLRKASPLKARGITGGQTFTGTTEDMSRLLKEMQEGRPGWMKAFAKMEALAHKADAATRQSQYESYRAQGLSDMEAELMALESMNFSKRGLSPTMHMASMLVPFLNAQIQGLDVLYKALTGKMPFNDKLDIQRKLFTRGASMFALTMAYAAAMQDDEEYKNAPPDVKYGNWFLRLPFLDEMAGEKVTLRVPIPFEVGYIFKALPEMLYNSMKSDRGAKEALEALNHILIQVVPGGSSMVPIEIGGAKIPVPVPIPAAMKPVIEVGLGKSFFTGRDLESAREQQEVPGMRFRERTSEIAKYIGESVNFSPIKIEALVNGYTGGLGLLMLQALSLPLPKADVVVPEKRWSELPLVGSMFQPADASNIIDGVYKDFQKVTQAKTTYDNLLVKGETGKAQAFLQQNLQLIMLNQMAGEYKKMMGDLTRDERVIRGSNLTAEEKRKLVDQIKASKIQIAASVRAVLERKEPQAAPA